MWAYELISQFYTVTAIGMHTVIGIALMLGLFHAIVGRNGYVYLATIISLTALTADGSTKIFMMFGQFPVMGGSLYMPILFGVISMCSFEMPDKNARAIMLCSLFAILLMAVVDARIIAFEFFHPDQVTDLQYSTHVGNLTVMFVSGILVYFTMNARLAMTSAGVAVTLFWRYTYVLLTLAAATVIQLVTYHKEYVMDNPDVILNTVLLRFLVSSGVGVTYYYRFNGRPPATPKKQRLIDGKLSEKRLKR